MPTILSIPKSLLQAKKEELDYIKLLQQEVEEKIVAAFNQVLTGLQIKADIQNKQEISNYIISQRDGKGMLLQTSLLAIESTDDIRKIKFAITSSIYDVLHDETHGASPLMHEIYTTFQHDALFRGLLTGYFLKMRFSELDYENTTSIIDQRTNGINERTILEAIQSDISLFWIVLGYLESEKFSTSSTGGNDSILSGETPMEDNPPVGDGLPKLIENQESDIHTRINEYFITPFTGENSKLSIKIGQHAFKMQLLRREEGTLVYHPQILKNNQWEKISSSQEPIFGLFPQDITVTNEEETISFTAYLKEVIEYNELIRQMEVSGIIKKNLHCTGVIVFQFFTKLAKDNKILFKNFFALKRG